MRTAAAVLWQTAKFQDLLRDEDLKSLNVMRHGRSSFLFYGGRWERLGYVLGSEGPVRETEDCGAGPSPLVWQCSQGGH
jgi:hypothetical protein